ncbi:MFS transporter [Novipirellula artificiosorum]|uniref:Putative nucleoside transporter YegT n=1 Tax=Novipirellula artificiosorum TaxID=2528016 RepID=A0A5C6DUZ7_9BACT|nr:MFS transporter [Novipirellula artificiosorum]TWU39767.1 putative nucleoside transporter YegT [Novipirellula artificiosorum]
MSDNHKMSLTVRVQLSAMMFLQFMLFAVWFVQLSAYATDMGVSGVMLSLIVSSMAIGCLVSPIVGMIADRHFASQKVLGVLNGICTLFLVIAAQVTDPTLLFLVLLGAMLCYMPTWGLTSAIAMANGPVEKFPQIRVFGSLGWVASGIFSLLALKIFGMEAFDGTNLPFYCGAATCAVATVVALLLPDTPPPAKGQETSIVDALGLRAFALTKDFHFALFIIVSVLVMIPFSIYWSYGSVFLKDAGFKQLTLTMNWGQAAEMVFMLMIPIALKQLGVKWSMTVGLLALLARYVSFYFGSTQDIQSLFYVAILVHGLIFGFFFVGGQIYIDKYAPRELRAQAQGFIFLMTFGIGLLIGNFVNGELIARHSVESIVDGETIIQYDWGYIWMVNLVISLVLLIVFALLFKDTSKLADVSSAAEGN